MATYEERAKALEVLNAALIKDGTDAKAIEVIRVKVQSDGWRDIVYFFECLADNGLTYPVIGYKDFPDGNVLDYWHVSFIDKSDWVYWHREKTA